MSTDLHSLSGAYALDALSEDERAEFEAHLVECEVCREEVADMQATLGDVCVALEEEPPPGLKNRVLAEIDQTPQDAPLEPRTQAADVDVAADRAEREPTTPPVPARSRDDELGERRAEGSPAPVDELAARRAAPAWWTGMMATAAAIVAILAVGVSLVVTNLNQQVDDAEVAMSEMAEVLAAPDAQSLTAEGPDGSFGRVVMSASRGEAVFLVDGMAPAPEDHTYELWLIDDAGAHSAGLFDVDESGRVTRIMSGDMERAAAIGVTVEPEGGSPEPTTDPIMLIEVADA